MVRRHPRAGRRAAPSRTRPILQDKSLGGASPPSLPPPPPKTSPPRQKTTSLSTNNISLHQKHLSLGQRLNGLVVRLKLLVAPRHQAYHHRALAPSKQPAPTRQPAFSRQAPPTKQPTPSSQPAPTRWRWQTAPSTQTEMTVAGAERHRGGLPVRQCAVVGRGQCRAAPLPLWTRAEPWCARAQGTRRRRGWPRSGCAVAAAGTSRQPGAARVKRSKGGAVDVVPRCKSHRRLHQAHYQS